MRDKRPEPNRYKSKQGRQAAILLFDAKQATAVLPAFVHFLTTRFSPADCVAGVFAAVGAIHRDTDRPDRPNCVAHYWDGYDHELARIEAPPATMIGYLRSGVRDAAGTGDVRPITEKAAHGLLRMATMLNSSVRHPNRANRFRQLVRILEHDGATLRRFQLLCWKVASGDLPTNARVWQTWKKPITDIATALLEGTAAASADDFMAWEDEHVAVGAAPTPGNIFCYSEMEPAVRIKVGSIHSVKGETHLATLVFDTHYKGSHFTRIKDWLIGARSGLTANKPELRKSLKQHYVAMTRPSHLLCVAMRADAFTDAELELLRTRNWDIGDITNRRIVWRP